MECKFRKYYFSCFFTIGPVVNSFTIDKYMFEREDSQITYSINKLVSKYLWSNFI